MWSPSSASLCSQHKDHCSNLAHEPFMNWRRLISPTLYLSSCSTPNSWQFLECVLLRICCSVCPHPPWYTHVLYLLPATFTSPLPPSCHPQCTLCTPPPSARYMYSVFQSSGVRLDDFFFRESSLNTHI